MNPVMADAWLSAEIARAARDPGAKGVFRCSKWALKDHHHLTMAKQLTTTHRALTMLEDKRLTGPARLSS